MRLDFCRPWAACLLMFVSVGVARADSDLDCGKTRKQVRETFKRVVLLPEGEAARPLRDFVQGDLWASVDKVLGRSLSEADRAKILAYARKEAGAPSTEEIQKMLSRVRSENPEYAKVICAGGADSIINETGYANVAASRNGFSLCRKVVKKEETGRFLAGVFGKFVPSCGWTPTVSTGTHTVLGRDVNFSVSLPYCTMDRETTNIAPDVTITYSHSLPISDRSIDIVEPEAVTASLTGYAPPGPDRFLLRMCYGVSETGIKAERACVTMNLAQLAAYPRLQPGSVVAQRPSQPKNIAISDPCKLAVLEQLQGEQSHGVSHRQDSGKTAEGPAAPAKSSDGHELEAERAI